MLRVPHFLVLYITHPSIMLVLVVKLPSVPSITILLSNNNIFKIETGVIKAGVGVIILIKWFPVGE